MSERKTLFLKVISLIMVIYGSIVLFLIGPFRIFSFFYLLSGITLFLCVRSADLIRGFFPEKIRKVLLVCIGLAILIFLATEALIVSFSMRPCEKGADYVIVLGSQIRENGPSMDYQARLDSAFAYLSENRDSLVICTGAKGDSEPITEAEGGKRYLMGKGIEEKRILTEDESFSTLQNLKNAKKIIEKKTRIEDAKVVIVSADYHLFRASYIAGKLGYENVSCKGGHGLWILLPHYYTREFFALGKELLLLR